MTSRPRLQFTSLLCYSIGNVPLTAIYGFLGAFLLKFYSDHVKLDPAWIGWAFLARSLVDAAIDPLIGYVSDRTQLPQGRRRPYFLLGTIPAAILFYLMMTPPTGSQVVSFVYLTIISTLMVCFLSVMGITHLALGFELTADYDERTRIFGYKNFVENLTILVATFSVPLALHLDETIVLGHVFSRADCYCVAAAGLAVVSIVAAVIAYVGTTEFQTNASNHDDRFFESLLRIFKNKAFCVLSIVFILITIADRVIVAGFFIMLEQIHGIREENSISLLIGFFVGGLLSVWPWVWLAQRFGKDVILRLAMIAWPFSCAAIVVRQWSEFELCVATFFMGVFGTGMITILGAIVPDVLEYDRDVKNRRNEGMYVSVGNVIYQVAVGIGFLVAGQTLHAIGYRGEQTPSSNLIGGLQITFVAIPFLSSFSALGVFAYFPITRQSYLTMIQPEPISLNNG